MWAIIRTLIKGLLLKWFLKWQFIRTLIKSLTLLIVVIPLAIILMLFGWPVLKVLVVLAVLVVVLLLVMRLPALIATSIGGILMAIVAAALQFGLLVLKVVVPIALVVWLVRKVFGRNGKPAGGTPPPMPPESGENPSPS
jgi:hypothetical protein